ncbi:HET-domain-containing protein [Thozetella sp. PMI_491]|nr:HET-domain-containing protein [Thozetella sp. PMI_491]
MEASAGRVFQKLGSRQFRLLYLQPTRTLEQETEFADIAGELKVASLEDAPAYEAVSYVWGDPRNSVGITIDGLDFPVTRTLYRALNRLVLKDHLRIVWVDAICINQADLAERSQQVNHMRHIYQNATSVAAFLGDPYSGIEIALQYLSLSAEDNTRHVQPSLQPHLSAGKLDANSDELAIALIKLFYLPWWKRVWTVQEFLLARDVIFYCGPRQISASILARGASNLIKHGRSCCDPNSGSFSRKFSVSEDDGISHDVWHGLNNFLGLTAWAGTSPSIRDFHWTLTLFRRRLSTDQRDKIYGLLGLAPEELDGRISLDYTAAVEHVFETFTMEYIQHYKRLDLLGALGGDRRLLNLPSFCPDWTITPSDDPSNDETAMVQLSNRIVLQRLHLGASGKSEAMWRRTAPSTVAVNGFVFDVIRDVSPECFRQPWEERQLWAKSIRTLAEHVETESLLKALCGRWIWSIERQEYALVQDNVENIENRLEKWWKWTSAGDGYSSGQERDLISVEQAVLTASAGRSFVVTQKGYIGYAAQQCRPGHVVSILGGGCAPFVLAPHLLPEPRYKVIGDAYIHGIMQGEAFELAGRQAHQFDEIILT